MPEITIDPSGEWEHRVLAVMAGELGCTSSQLATAIVYAAVSEGVMDPHTDDCDRLRAMRGYIEGYTRSAAGGDE